MQVNRRTSSREMQVNDVHKHGEADRKVDIAPCDVHA